eukprot:6268027-Amphidinium_carterae.1
MGVTKSTKDKKQPCIGQRSAESDAAHGCLLRRHRAIHFTAVAVGIELMSSQRLNPSQLLDPLTPHCH